MVDLQELRTHLQWLRGKDRVVSQDQAEQVMAQVLNTLLKAEGYTFSANKSERQLDFYALLPGNKPSSAVRMSVEYRHHMGGRPLTSNEAQTILNSTLERGLDRVMLIVRHGFTKDALEMAQRSAPVRLELLTLDDLEARVDHIESSSVDASETLKLTVRTLAHDLALLVARNPMVLDEVEWRDLERIVARILEGLGFRITLTRPSRDGGKDVIAECRVAEGPRSYIVELKHWAPANVSEPLQ